jgi:hypothetical protein
MTGALVFTTVFYKKTQIRTDQTRQTAVYGVEPQKSNHG